MIRNLLATTALATLVSTGAFAQDATAPAPVQPAPATQEAAPAKPEVVALADGYLATNIIGESVFNGTGDDAQNIGDVNDIVIGADGKIASVVIGVGGFLGIGEKNVAVDYATVDWAEKDGDRWLVVPATKEQLEAQPEFDSTPYAPTPAPVAVNEPAAPADPAAPAEAPVAEAPADPAAPADAPVAEAPADPAVSADAPVAEAPADPAAPADAPVAQAPADPAAPVDPAATAPDTTKTAAIDKSTLTEMPAADIRAEELVGTTVYGADDVNVGEIGDVVLTADGKVDAYIIDVGGFLGVGEKEVAVGSDNLAFMVDKDGNKYLYTSFTKEQLDAQAAYDKATYSEKRDDQRLTITQ